jgi:hypothetical protein
MALVLDGSNGVTFPSGAVSNGIVSGTTVASTSGTAITFSVPTTTKRITVMLSGVSCSGSAEVIFRLGTSGGIQSTGYLTASCVVAGGTAAANDTTGFRLYNNSGAAADVRNGSIIFSLLDSATGTWTGSGIFGQSDSARVGSIGGSKALSGNITQVQITTTNGTDTFTAGKINILYE